MKKMTPDQLKRTLGHHDAWLHSDGKDGARADLSEINLSGVDLSEANLLLAILSKTNLSGANLLLTDFSQADLSGADLSGADLSGADLLLADLSAADLSGADLSVVDLSGADLSKARLVAASLPQAKLAGAKLTEANLSGADLTGADLTGADLSGVNFSGANLSGASLLNARLCNANLLLISSDGADLTGADLSGSIIDVLTLARFPRDLVQRFQDSFKIIDPEHSSELSVIREIEIGDYHYQAVLSLIGYFTMFLAQRYSRRGVRVRVQMEITEMTIKVTVLSPSETVKNEIEELFEIYGLVLQKKLVPEALSNDLQNVRRLENQFRYVKAILASERHLYGSAQDIETEIERVWKHVGGSIRRIFRSDDPKNVEGEIYPPTTIQKFQRFIKSIKAEDKRIHSELSMLFQKFNLEFADSTDEIAAMKECLMSIREKSPERFVDIIQKFNELAIGDYNPVLKKVIAEVVSHEGREIHV
jgi:uncharacterized protein YjbI with pentapeptide repeats